MQSRARWLCIVYLAVLLILLAPKSAEADDDGVSFLNDKDRTITLTRDEPTKDIEVKVVSSKKQVIHFEIAGPFDEDGALIPSENLSLVMPLTDTDVVTGSVKSFPFTFTVTYTDELSGSYTGQFVAYGVQDHTLARLNFTLVVKPEDKPIEKAGAVLKVVGMVLLILLLVYVAGRWRILPWLRNLFCPRLDIEKFDVGATELAIGDGLPAMVEVALRRLEDEGDRPSAHLVYAPLEGLKLPADIKSVTPLGGVASVLLALFDNILPQNVIVLKGYLQKPGPLGAGLTLTLVEKRTNKIVANQTIWQKTYDPEMSKSDDKAIPAYYELVDQVAIWTYFQLNDHLEAHKKEADLPLDRKWQSHAYFRAGVRWMLKDKKSAARRMFVEALNQDTNNSDALFNLGVLDTEAGEYERALKRLEQVKEKAKQTETIWYKAAYQLAATNFYLALPKPGQDKSKQNQLDQKRKKAEEETRDLLLAINKNNQPLEQVSKKGELQGRDKALHEFLGQFLPLVKAMYPGILYGLESSPLEKLKKIKDLYDSQARADEHKNVAIALLNSLTKNEWLLTYRDRYNLACSWSTIGGLTKNTEEKQQCLKKALEHLEYALERGGGIVLWAQHDPSLKAVREDKKHEKKFWEFIKKYGDQTTPPPAPVFSFPTSLSQLTRVIRQKLCASACPSTQKTAPP